MLEKYLPSPFAAALDEAQQKLEAGDAAGAVALLRGAYEDSGRRHDIAMMYTQALIEARRLDEARRCWTAWRPWTATRPTSRRLRS
jgi:putative thioredoxin